VASGTHRRPMLAAGGGPRVHYAPLRNSPGACSSGAQLRRTPPSGRPFPRLRASGVAQDLAGKVTYPGPMSMKSQSNPNCQLKCRSKSTKVQNNHQRLFAFFFFFNFFSKFNELIYFIFLISYVSSSHVSAIFRYNF
jgi:hypothetical protein